MTRTGLCLAAVFGLAVSLCAQVSTAPKPQTQSTNDRDSIVVSGCLQKDASGGFTLANAQIEPARTDAATAGPAAGNAPSGTTGATAPAPAAEAPVPANWTIESSEADLSQHVGHRVQATGRRIAVGANPAATGATSGATAGDEAKPRTGAGDTDAARRLDVKSIKMISSSCS